LKHEQKKQEVSTKDIQHQLEFERLISGLSSKFINLPAEDVNAEIKIALKQVVEFFGADRGTLYQITPDRKNTEFVQTYTTEGTKPLPRLKASNLYPYCWPKILKGTTINFPFVEQMPEDALVDRENLVKMGVKSTLVIPIKDEGQYNYAISMVSLRDYKEWDPVLVNRVQLIGEILVTELKRWEAEEELRLKERAIETSISGIGMIDLNGQVIYANESLMEMWGYKRYEEFIGRPVQEFFSEDKIDKILEELSIAGGSIGEEVGKRKDGTFFDVQYSASIIRDENGFPKYMYGSFIDITESKKEKEALRKSEFSQAEAQRIGKMGSWTWNIQTGNVEWSPELYRLLEFDPASITPSKDAFLEKVHSEDRPSLEIYIQNLISNHQPFSADHRIVLPDGSTKHVQSIGRIELDENSNPSQLFGIMQDITERKRVEEELKVKDFAIASSINGIGITDLDGKMIYVNDSCVRMWGYESANEIIGKPIFDFWVGEGIKKTTRDLLTTGHSFGEDTARRKDGSAFEVQYSANMIKNENGQPIYMLGSFIDITDLKLKRRALEESERTLADAQRLAHLGNWEWDIGTNTHKSSSEVYRIFGLDQERTVLTEKTFMDCIHPEDKERVGSEINSIMENPDYEYNIDYKIIRPDGSERNVHAQGKVIFDASNKPVKMFGTVHDITELKRIEEESAKLRNELAHMERIGTVGAMTAALAHEINQPLAAILSNAQAALRFLDQEKPDLTELKEILTDIVSDDKRAGEVINRLRHLVKKSDVLNEPYNLNSIINEVLNLLRSEILLRKASVIVELDPSVAQFNGDRIQIQQVILNLLMNALDGVMLSPKEKRNIKITTSSEKGVGVTVSVTDSGAGIEDENLDNIFEAFYTTKDKGMGMGLPICKSIIQANGGIIWADKSGDSGAKFSFWLPFVNNNS
jgi:PAS domain S-box-containing protein